MSAAGVEVSYWPPLERRQDPPLSRRDYFAGLAMHGLIASYPDEFSVLQGHKALAHTARDIADQLVAVLARSEPGEQP